MWQMTGDTWKVTSDMWHMTHYRLWTLCKTIRYLALIFWNLGCLEDLEQKDWWQNYLGWLATMYLSSRNYLGPSRLVKELTVGCACRKNHDWFGLYANELQFKNFMFNQLKLFKKKFWYWKCSNIFKRSFVLPTLNLVLKNRYSG